MSKSPERHQHTAGDNPNAAVQERALWQKLHDDTDFFLKGNANSTDTAKLHTVMIHYDDRSDSVEKAREQGAEVKQNQQIQKDFDIVNKALPTDYGIDKTSMQTLAFDSNQSPAVRESAARLAQNWDKNKDLTQPSDNWADGLMNAEGVKNGLDRRDGALKRDKEDRDAESQTREDLKPRQDILDKAQIKAGDGPYQVAEKLLKTIHGKHIDYREVKELSDVLMRHFRADNPGRDGKVFKTTDYLITAQNFDKIMDDVAAQSYGGKR